MEVRPTTLDDLAALQAVSDTLFDAPVTAERLASYLVTPDHLMLVALHGSDIIGQVRGMIQHHPDRASEIYVENLAVDPRHRRRGVARALIEAMLAWGRSRGCTLGWVGTEIDNDAANALYRGLGRAELANMYLIEL